MFKEINNLRKSWKLEEAYNLAIQEYNKNPDDKFIKSAYSWVLYDYIKKSNNINDFENYFQEFLALNIESSWEVDIKWMICNILYNFLKQEKNINNYKKILLYYTKLNLDINSETHKFIFIYIFKKEKDENFKKQFDLVEFIKLVPFEIFKKSSFHEEYKTEDWIKVPTLFEKIITIIWEKIKNSKNTNDLWDIDFLEKVLKYWIEKNWKWAWYYLWKLFLIKWDYTLALKYIKEVVKKEKTQFWSWCLLWEILLKLWKNDLYFSWLSKSLSVWKDDDFLNNLRLEYLSELEKRWFENEANIELNKIIENKIKNWYKIDEELIKLKNKKWFKENTSWNNYNFYKKFINDIEKFLYEDIPNTIIYIKYINKEKNIINFIGKNREKWFFNYWNININWLNIWDIIYAKIEKVDNEYYNVFNLNTDSKLIISDIFKFENIIINNINRDKKLLNFSWDYKKWFFNYSWFENIIKNMNNWDFLNVIFDENNWEYYKVFDFKEDKNILKDFNWYIKIPKRWNFWFIDDIFINENFIDWIDIYNKISWVAKKIYNKKENKIWWKCISID